MYNCSQTSSAEVQALTGNMTNMAATSHVPSRTDYATHEAAVHCTWAWIDQ